MNYVWAFVVGGAICVAGQLMIDLTAMTPARILVIFVVSGVVLSALGVWDILVDFAGAGATVPIIGFGNTLAKGVLKGIRERGFLGVFTGGTAAAAGGIAASIFFGFLAAIIFKPRQK